MISVAEAESLILEHVPGAAQISMPIESVSGEILRGAIRADRPFPPFDRVAMDGIAIRRDAWCEGASVFPVSGTQRAGEPRKTLEDPGSCLEVMTGAMLPEGCDCVIPVEMIDIQNDSAKLKDDYKIDPIQNVHQLGSDRQQGDALLDAGTVMFGPQCAVAATVGATEVSVGERPRIAVVSTGDELVAVGETPEPHQIRRSNGYALKSLLSGAGFTNTELYHFRDDPEAIEQGLGDLLKTARFMLISGGVSAGRFDHVPEVLGRLGVKQIFHKVSQRPGKPLWFGIGPEGQAVFGLPGNPVSGVVCCYRYVLSALWKSLGATLLATDEGPHAVLGDEIRFKRPLTLFKPVTVGAGAEGAQIATPVAMGGSGDLAGLADSDGFVELDAEQDVFGVGARYPLWLWSDPYLHVQTP